MDTFLVALIFFGLFTTLMAVGVIFSRKPLKGSCGGLSALSEKTGSGPLCEICGEDPRTKTGPCNPETLDDSGDDEEDPRSPLGSSRALRSP